ncbi:unnamed protein product, partial [Owenia fusiformis]
MERHGMVENRASSAVKPNEKISKITPLGKVLKYKCAVCEYSSPDRYHNVLNHITRTHLKFPLYRCAPCKKTFATHRAARFHNEQRHTKKTACERCAYPKALSEKVKKGSTVIIGNKAWIETKMKNHLEKVEKKRIQMEAKSDVESEHEDAEVVSSYKCGLCDLTRDEKGIVKRHVYEVHMRMHRNTCKHCTSSFRERQALVEHHKENHSKKKLTDIIEERPELYTEVKDTTMTIYPPKSFAIPEETSKGEAEESDTSCDDEPTEQDQSLHNFQCGICDFNRDVRNLVVRHVYYVHMKLFKYTCTICRKMFRELRQSLDYYSSEHNVKNAIASYTDLPTLDTKVKGNTLFFYEPGQGSNGSKTKTTKAKSHDGEKKQTKPTIIKQEIVSDEKENHVKSYECGICKDYKTVRRGHIERHFFMVHLNI